MSQSDGSSSNPGSLNHPDCCKPCNKFNPLRPYDSCKRGDLCNFCHGDHSYTRHRGQRGRHASQKHEYDATRQHMQPDFCELVDRIYRTVEPLNQLREQLCELSPGAQKTRVEAVVGALREIGEKAQTLRGGASGNVAAHTMGSGEACSSVPSLTVKWKWLQGLLHQVVRKTWDNNSNNLFLKGTIRECLELCHELPAACRDAEWRGSFVLYVHGKRDLQRVRVVGQEDWQESEEEFQLIGEACGRAMLEARSDLAILSNDTFGARGPGHLVVEHGAPCESDAAAPTEGHGQKVQLLQLQGRSSVAV